MFPVLLAEEDCSIRLGQLPDKTVFYIFLVGWGRGGGEGCFARESIYWLDFEILIFF